MSNLDGAPPQVLEVHNAMVANAQEMWDSPCIGAEVYTRPETRYNSTTNEYTPTGSWLVGPNFEGWGSAMVFKEGTWFYRGRGDGVDRPMKGGHEEALGNASCFFTG